MKTVETSIVDIGRRSDSRVLDKIAINYAHTERRQKDASMHHPSTHVNAVDPELGRDQLAFHAQLALLQNCLSAVSQMSRERGSTLRSAKLLVVSRLLFKIVSATSEDPLLKTLEARLGNLRQKLLRNIDRRFARSSRNNAILVEDMTAFALVTRSTPGDVLKHFQHVRLESIRRARDLRGAEYNILRRINVLLSTLRDVRAYFPEMFASSLKLLNTRPLLDDTTISGLDELRLDIYLQWLPEALRNYTPYTRHDELDRNKAGQLSSRWGDEACRILVTAIAQEVAAVHDLETVLSTRKSALQLWLTSSRTARGIPWLEVLDNLRACFLQQAQKLINESANDFQTSVSNAVLDTLQDWSAEAGTTTNTSLWDDSLHHMDASEGALRYRKAILSRRTGGHSAIETLVTILLNERKRLQTVQNTFKDMKDTRWEYDEDDDLDEDSSDLFSPASTLSRTDPEQLQSNFRQSLVDAIKGIETSLTSRSMGSLADFTSTAAPGPFLLRALRELRHHIPLLLSTFSPAEASSVVCSDLVIKIQESLGSSLTRQSEAIFPVELSRFVNSRYNVQALWSGEPSLPVQPSTEIFKYLRSTVKNMEAMGTDLWSPDALGRYKLLQQQSLQMQLVEILHVLTDDGVNTKAPTKVVATINGDPPVQVNGDELSAASTDGHIPDEAADQERRSDDNILTILGIPHASDDNASPLAIVNGTPHDGEEDSAIAVSLSSREDTIDNTSEHEPENHKVTTTAPSSKPSQPELMQIQQKTLQIFFDILYLDLAFSLVPASSVLEPSPLYSIAMKFKDEADVDDAAEARVVKSATEYWRRTYLLFGLLAG
jgi:hypothetical protein